MPTPIIDALKDDSDLTMHTHTEADLGATLDNRYVNVTGDTMTGALTIAPTANSTSIFNIKNQAGANVLLVDTTNRRIGVNTIPTLGQLEFQAIADNSETLLVFKNVAGDGKLSLYGTGNAFFSGNASTALSDSNSSPGFSLQSTRWNGSASVTEQFSIYNARYDSSAGRYALWFNDQNGLTRLAIGAGTYGQVAIGYNFPADAGISLGQFYVRPTAADVTGIGIWSYPGQTAPLQKWFDKDGVALASVDKDGIGTFVGLVSPYWRPSSDSTTALQIRNASGTSIINVNSTNSRVGINSTSSNSALSLQPKIADDYAMEFRDVNGSIIALVVNDPNYLGFAGQNNANFQFRSAATTNKGFDFKIGHNTGYFTFSDTQDYQVLKMTETYGAVFNELAHPTYDVRMESANNTHAFFLDGSADTLYLGSSGGGVIVPKVASDKVTISVKGASSQTANLTEWQNSSGTVLASISPLGGAVFNENGEDSDFRVESDTEANMLYLDANADTDGALYLGGSTNGLKINKGGKLTAIGTATWYDDIRVEPTVRGAGTKVPTYTQWTPSGGSASGLYCYLFDNAVLASEKEVNFKIQLPHGKLLGSAIHLHVHWMPTSTGSAGDKVRWGLEYTKANPNAAFSAPGASIYATDPISPPSTTPTVDTHYITEFSDIDMTGDALSTILLCRLFRNSSNAADSFAGDVMLLYIDCHVEHSQLGSNDEYSQ